MMRSMASGVTGPGQPEQVPDLRLVIDSAPALIHTALPDGYLDFFNEAWLKYVGLSLQELQGWAWTAVIHPEDVEAILHKWRASLASGDASSMKHACGGWMESIVGCCTTKRRGTRIHHRTSA
jgi:PAS domain-containing protein